RSPGVLDRRQGLTPSGPAMARGPRRRRTLRRPVRPVRRRSSARRPSKDWSGVSFGSLPKALTAPYHAGHVLPGTTEFVRLRALLGAGGFAFGPVRPHRTSAGCDAAEWTAAGGGGGR